MFDNMMVAKNNFKFENHSASGLLCKSMIKSKIIRFDKGSLWEDTIFSLQPYIKDDCGNRIKIIVLQVLLVSDKGFVIEYITEKDYNEELGYYLDAVQRKINL